MEFLKTPHHLIFVFLLVSFISLSQAYQFNVGGKQGWVLNPSENYNHWAGRLRFLVNDTLFFKYNKESDSVLVVNKDDYDKCNTQNPIAKLDDGNSVFKFNRSGPFYFITGNKTNCDKGQKLIVVVLAVRTPPSPPTPSVGPPAPALSPPAKSPSPAVSPVAQPPASSSAPAVSPVLPPSPALSPTPAVSSPSPVTQTPVPSPATSLSPSSTPVGSPAPAGVSPALAPSPATETSGPISPPPSSETPTPFAPSPSAISPPPAGNTTAEANSPSAASAFTASVVLVSTVSLVLNMVLAI